MEWLKSFVAAVAIVALTMVVVTTLVAASH